MFLFGCVVKCLPVLFLYWLPGCFGCLPRMLLIGCWFIVVCDYDLCLFGLLVWCCACIRFGFVVWFAWLGLVCWVVDLFLLVGWGWLLLVFLFGCFVKCFLFYFLYWLPGCFDWCSDVVGWWLLIYCCFRL